MNVIFQSFGFVICMLYDFCCEIFQRVHPTCSLQDAYSVIFYLGCIILEIFYLLLRQGPQTFLMPSPLAAESLSYQVMLH